jgi:hypothetical protein
MTGANLILDEALRLVLRLLLDPLRQCAVQLAVHHNHLFKLELGS